MKRIVAIIAIVAMSLFAVCTASAQEKTFKVDEIETEGDAYLGKTIAVEGLCSHLCSHGGRKMFLRGKKNLIRIESTAKTGAFKAEAVNEPVRVIGTLAESRIDETYLKNWEERLAKGNKVGEHSGCETESAARGEKGDTDRQKIDNFRQRIAERNAKEGKNYLSVYYVVADSYTIL